ncbi:MAG: cupin domain-containing protein [Alphaproteobacteria bacterium]
MEINADFSKDAIVRPGEVDWTPSPLPGVDRIMLDRVGDEVARATSFVRYAAGSRFDAHAHDLGEEFLVIDGVFSDADGDYGPGAYVRNPPGTSHAPWSEQGCTIFVKLRQFQDGDTERKVIDINKGTYVEGRIPGAERLYLHEFGDETVWISKIEPGTHFPEHVHPGGEEFIVLEGEIRDENHVFPKGSWIRFPDDSRHSPYTDTGALLWVKVGHLG